MGRRLLVGLGYLALAGTVLAVLGRGAAVPGMNILALELAGSAARARQVLGNVPPADVRRALYADTVFIAGYSLLLAIPPALLARRVGRLPRLIRLAPAALALVPVTAGLDLVENAALLRGLEHPARELPWRVAAAAASPKWVLATLLAGYALLVLGGYLAGRPARPSRRG